MNLDIPDLDVIRLCYFILIILNNIHILFIQGYMGALDLGLLKLVHV